MIRQRAQYQEGRAHEMEAANEGEKKELCKVYPASNSGPAMEEPPDQTQMGTSLWRFEAGLAHVMWKAGAVPCKSEAQEPRAGKRGIGEAI